MTRSSNKDSTDLDRLAATVTRLSRMLTRDRDHLPGSYLRDPELRRAYRAYFLPANLPKIHVPLAEIALHPDRLLDRERLRVLDIGTGPGTSVLGMLAFFGQRERRPTLAFTAVDQVGENLRVAEALFVEHRKAYGGGSSLQTLRCGAEEVTARTRERFDLIVFSNVLNELFAGDEDRIEKRTRLVGNVMRELLEEGGSCIVIEPALRDTSREMLQVRDSLLFEGFPVYSPCLAQAPCPALRHPKDWCHEDIAWDAPGTIRDIDARTGLRKDALKFSYLVLRQGGLSLRDMVGVDAMRVVSEPLVSKGKREYYCCGPAGRRLVVRLDKDASPANLPFQDLRRGDVVRFERLMDEQKRFRVTKETMVIRVKMPCAS
jgi:SAM-dependent methyltransferase